MRYVWLFLFVALLAGCGHQAPARHTGHGPDDAPITEAHLEMPTDFPAAVKRLRSYSTEIEEAIMNGMPSKAHQPLDEANIVIGKVIYIARDSGVPKGDWEEASLARNALRENLDKLRVAIDAGRPPDLPAVEPAIEEALEHLEAMADKSQQH